MVFEGRQPCPLAPPVVVPSVNVVKKFSTLKLATLRVPPTGGGKLLRGFARTKTGAIVGCNR